MIRRMKSFAWFLSCLTENNELAWKDQISVLNLMLRFWVS